MPNDDLETRVAILETKTQGERERLWGSEGNPGVIAELKTQLVGMNRQLTTLNIIVGAAALATGVYKTLPFLV